MTTLKDLRKKKEKQEQGCAILDEPITVVKDIAFTDEILDALEAGIKKEYPFTSEKGEKEYLSIPMLERLLVIDLYRKVSVFYKDRAKQPCNSNSDTYKRDNHSDS